MFNPIQFAKEVKSELTKVVWPSRRDVVRITIAVIAFSLAVAIILGAVDFGLTAAIEKYINKP